MEIHPYYTVCGVDVSRHQIIDFKKAREAGVKFAIIRGGNGLNKDDRFEEHARKAEEAGMPYGVYWYFRPMWNKKVFDQRKQARFARSSITRRPKLGYFIDLEWNPIDGWNFGTDLTTMDYTNLVLKFLREADTIFSKRWGIYTSPGFWNSRIYNRSHPDFLLSQRALWVANWPFSFTRQPSLPRGWSRWDIWQFSGDSGVWKGKGSEFGVTYSSSVDLNVYNGDMEEFNRKFGIHEPLEGGGGSRPAQAE